jgi:hypothetical protein
MPAVETGTASLSRRSIRRSEQSAYAQVPPGVPCRKLVLGKQYRNRGNDI